MTKILITGGNFINKGAQSMLFCVVDSLTKEYPGAEIVMIDLFPTLGKREKEKYKFKVVNMHIRTVLRIGFPILKALVKPKAISNPETEILNHFKTADLIVDISGYGVSSHNQSPIWTYATLFPVKLAQKHNVPFVFLPQSIGPFEFKSWKKVIVWPFIKKYIKYPKLIFIREPKCRAELNKCRTEGIIDSFDIVLQSEEIDIDNIYKNAADENMITIKDNSVVVIPNKQLIKLTSNEDVVGLFADLIESLLAEKYEVAIVRHSADDKDICNEIYEKVKADNIQLINENLTPYQIQNIFEQSSIVISSRYHGLIHALKLNKPCLVIGWAHKYQHVMDAFNLSAYYYNIKDFDTKKIISSSLGMLANKEEIKNSISTKIKSIRATNLFDYIKGK